MIAPDVIWVDGEPHVALPLPDRGLDYGDGLFETLLLVSATPVFLELHLQRLRVGLDRLRFPDCWELARQLILQAANSIDPAHGGCQLLRMTVTRGGGTRGYAPAATSQPRFIIRISGLTEDPTRLQSPARLGLANIAWSTQPLLAGLKHLNRLEQVLASMQRAESGYDELVMQNQSGAPVSVCAGNLFVVKDNELLTPKLDQCGIAGTRRRLIMDRWGSLVGIPVREQCLTMNQLLDADELFYSNSAVGVRPVDSFGGRRWQRHPVCEALHRCYRKALR